MQKLKKQSGACELKQTQTIIVASSKTYELLFVTDSVKKINWEAKGFNYQSFACLLNPFASQLISFVLFAFVSCVWPVILYVRFNADVQAFKIVMCWMYEMNVWMFRSVLASTFLLYECWCSYSKSRLTSSRFSLVQSFSAMIHSWFSKMTFQSCSHFRIVTIDTGLRYCNISVSQPLPKSLK